jgi:predicted DNA-binding transcriptional regulator YafY
MPRKEGQKRKLLVLIALLARETDEHHPLSVPRLVELLAQNGVEAERKSIYDDIATLNDLPGSPFEIVQSRGRGGGYYMAATPFEVPELKLLVDAVYASRFITARKSKTLIEKLGRFVSRYEEETLDRKVLVSGRVKSTDEKILYTVDTLHTAITNGNQVTFRYCDWTMDKKMEPRRGGAAYIVSPWVLVWDGGNYYLIAYAGAEAGLRHFRVDKMTHTEALPDTAREGAAAYEKFDVNAYMQQMFGMFSGPVREVTLRCAAHLAGAMIDRFGTGPSLVPCGQKQFDIHVTVQVSPQFYGWVAGFAGSVEIVSPPEVREEMRHTLEGLQQMYEAQS